VQPKHILPNAVTLTNIVFGFLGIIAAAGQHFERSVVLLFCAALCDLFDGRLARLLNATSRFGMELDSLSDAISFGIAPAVLIYLAVLHRIQPPVLGIVVAVVYVVCGVLRLARFNVDTGTLSKVTFVGCPIPVAAGYLLSFVMVRDGLPVWLMALLTVVSALMMVSTLKIPKFVKGGLPSSMLFLGMALFIAFLFQPRALTWHLWNGWNWVMLITNYVFLRRKGHLGPKPAEEASAPKAAV
jgi:CDP-diacylglycerol--serine O-phosphatidyltransferase